MTTDTEREAAIQGDDSFDAGIFDEPGADTQPEKSLESDFDFHDPETPTPYSQDDGDEEEKEDKGDKAGDDPSGGDPKSGGGTDDNTGEIPEELIGVARQFGISREHAKSFPNETELKNFLDGLGGWANAYRESITPKEQQQQQKQPEGDTQAGEIQGKLELSFEDGWDPDVVDKFNSINDYYAKEIATLKQELHQVVKANSDSLERAREGRFDNFINKLGEDYQELYGEGDSYTLDPTSAEFKNRVAVWKEAGFIVDAYRRRGENISEAEVFRKAVNAVHGDKVLKLKEQKSKRPTPPRGEHGQFISRPSSKSTFGQDQAEMSDEEKAIEAVRAKGQERGVWD